MLSHEYWIERTAKMLEQDTTTLRQHIEALLRDYPDLAEDEILRADMLEGETDIREIVTQIYRLIDDAKALIDGTTNRMDELAARRGRFKQRMEFGRDLILKIFDSAQVRKLELPEVTVSLRSNKPVLIGDRDPRELPDQYVKVAYSLDRTKIREAIEGGVVIDGFTLSNAPPSLVLKVK